jgi:hypothetical protein
MPTRANPCVTSLSRKLILTSSAARRPTQSTLRPAIAAAHGSLCILQGSLVDRALHRIER